MNLKHLFTKAFLFKPEYLGVQRADKILALFGLAAIVAAIAFKIFSRFAQTPVAKKYTHKFYRLFLTIGIMLVVWYGCVYESLRFLSFRLFAGLILAFGLVWFIRIVVSMAKHYSAEKAEYEKQQLKLKYLPK